MGYTTYFDGQLNFDKPVDEKHVAYIKKFCETRRMKRDPLVCAEMHDPIRQAVNLPVGPDGCYFVGGHGFFGQDKDESVLDSNQPPGLISYNKIEEGKENIAQPGLWCQWTISDDRCSLLWDGGEKFYAYTEWLKYLIKHFFEPWGYKLNGQIKWLGESNEDIGVIYCKDNMVEGVPSEITNPGPSWEQDSE